MARNATRGRKHVQSGAVGGGAEHRAGTARAVGPPERLVRARRPSGVPPVRARALQPVGPRCVGRADRPVPASGRGRAPRAPRAGDSRSYATACPAPDDRAADVTPGAGTHLAAGQSTATFGTAAGLGCFVWLVSHFST